LFPTDDSVSHKRDPKRRPGRCNYPYFHSKAEGEFSSNRKGVRKRGVCVDIREKITNDHWASGRRAGGRGDGLKYCGPFALPPDLHHRSPPVGYRFLLVFHSVPPKNHKFHSSFFLHTFPIYTSLLLSPAVFFPSILNGSDNKCYSAAVAPRTNTLNPPIGRRREPAPSSCAAICNYHNSGRLVFFITHTHTNTSCVRKHTHTHTLQTILCNITAVIGYHFQDFNNERGRLTRICVDSVLQIIM